MTAQLDERVLTQILTHTPDYILYVDTEYKIRYVSRTAHGYKLEDLLGRDLLATAPQTESEQTKAALQAVAESREEQSFVRHQQSPDGNYHWYQQRFSPILNEEGELEGFVIVITDVTKEKSAEQERDRAIEESRVASWMAGQAEMARTVIHNVGNVLNSALVTASLLEDQLQSTKLPQLQKAAQMLLDNQEQLQTFVTQDPRGQRLLGYLPKLAEKLNLQHQRLGEEARRLQENLHHVTSVIQAQKEATAQGGILERTAAEELLESAIRLSAFGNFDTESVVARDFAEVEPVLMDRHSVLQIVINLLQNAWDAMIDIPVQQRRVSVGVRPVDGNIEMSVGDSGPGVPRELEGKIFEAGFSTKPRGSGLGLHTGANAAAAMGGRLEYRPNGTGGAIFVLTLPLGGHAQSPRQNTRAA